MAGESGDNEQTGGEVDVNSQAFKDAVAKETADYKAQFDKLNSDYKAAQDRLSAFGDADPAKVKEMRDNAERAEREAMKKAGKHDELHKQDIARIEKEYKQRIDDTDKKYQSATEKYTALSERLVSSELKSACASVGAHPTAIDDIVSRAKGQFVLSEDGEIQAAPGNIDAKGNPRTIGDWVEGLRDTAPHLFAQPKGTGASGNTTALPKGTAMKRSEMSIEQKGEFIANFGQEAYFNLKQ